MYGLWNLPAGYVEDGETIELLGANWFTLDEIRQMHRTNQLRNDWPLRSIDQSLLQG